MMQQAEKLGFDIFLRVMRAGVHASGLPDEAGYVQTDSQYGGPGLRLDHFLVCEQPRVAVGKAVRPSEPQEVVDSIANDSQGGIQWCYVHYRKRQRIRPSQNSSKQFNTQNSCQGRNTSQHNHLQPFPHAGLDCRPGPRLIPNRSRIPV